MLFVEKLRRKKPPKVYLAESGLKIWLEQVAGIKIIDVLHCMISAFSDKNQFQIILVYCFFCNQDILYPVN